MKNQFCFMISVYACSALASDTPTFPLCVGTTTYSNTTIIFSIEAITEQPDRALLDIFWGEKNSVCETPFTRRYKETWSLSHEQADRIKELHRKNQQNLLADLLHQLANSHSIKLSTETLQDETCSSW